MRLSALSHLRVIYIMTHDSIGLGEDGPTHQPIETLAALRALPNMLTFRPADGNEVSGSYAVALQSKTTPSTLCLSRQNLPQLNGSSVEKVAFGGYVLECDGNPAVILVATGSEVSLCVEAAKQLRKESIRVRIVSMPCVDLFTKQSEEYRSQVLLSSVPILSVEALSTFGWSSLAHASIGMSTFGASGPYKVLVS